MFPKANYYQQSIFHCLNQGHFDINHLRYELIHQIKELHNINPFVVIILPNVIFAVNPLPTPFE